MKKIYFFCLMFVMSASVALGQYQDADLSAPQWAKDLLARGADGWHNHTQQPTENGSYRDPVWNMETTIYEIRTPEQLAWAVFNNGSISGKRVCFRLMNDIDLSAHPWITFDATRHTREFLSQHKFTFIFDGQGHTIRNLYNKDQSSSQTKDQEKRGNGNEGYMGLFPLVSGYAMFMNVNLENVYMCGPQGGSFIGRVEALNRPFKASDGDRSAFTFAENIVVRNAVVAGYGEVYTGKDYVYEQPIGGVIGTLHLRDGDGYEKKNRKPCVLTRVNFYGEVVATANRCTSIGGMLGEYRGNQGKPYDNGISFQNSVIAVDFVSRAADGNFTAHEWIGGVVGLAYRADGNDYSYVVLVNDNAAVKQRVRNANFGNAIGRLDNGSTYFVSAYAPNSGCRDWYGVKTYDGDITKKDDIQYTLPTSYRTNPLSPKESLEGMYDNGGKFPGTNVPVRFQGGRLVCLSWGGSDAVKFTSCVEGMRDITVSDDGYVYRAQTEKEVVKDRTYKTSEYVLLPNIDNARLIREKGYLFNGERMYRYLRDTLRCTVPGDDWSAIRAGGSQIVRLPASQSGDGVKFRPTPISTPVAHGVRGYTSNYAREFVVYWTNAFGKSTSDKGGWRVYRTLNGETELLNRDTQLRLNQREWHDKDLFTRKDVATLPSVQVTYTVVWVDESEGVTEDISYKCSYDFTLTVPTNQLQARQRETGEVDIDLSLPCYDWYQDCTVNFYRGIKVREQAGDTIKEKTKIDTQQFTFTSADKAAGKKQISIVDAGRKSICDGYVYWADLGIRDDGGTYHSAVIDTTSFMPYMRDRLIYLKASRGEYDDRVKLQWEMHYSSDKLRFTVQRRRIDPTQVADDASAVWEDRHTLIESKNVITYEDKVLPGHVYQYRLLIKPVCNETSAIGHLEEALRNRQYGYANNMGTVAGRITFKSNTGTSDISAQGVDVFVSTDESEMASFAMTHNAMRVAGSHSVETTIPRIAAKTFNEAGGKWTVQCHVNPDIDTLGDRDTMVVYRLPNDVRLLMCKGDANTFRMAVDADGVPRDCGLAISRNCPINFRHILLRGDAGKVRAGYVEHTFLQDGGKLDSVVWGEEIKMGKKMAADSTLCLFDATRRSAYVIRYHGDFDEFRVWGKVLTDEQILHNYNRYLAGTEDGMELYYTFDEAIATAVFDHQHRGNDWSDNVGEVRNHDNDRLAQLVLVRDYSPETQFNQTTLAAHGVTNEQGEYQIVGIPYAGSGTQYCLTPMLGTHKFNPAVSRRVFSNDSRTYTGVNFVDESSFDVNVKAMYALGTLPAEGLQVLVDGQPQTTSKGTLKTDIDGMAMVTVPIGKHRISLMSPYHTMLNPVDAEKPTEGLPCLERSIVGGEVTVKPYPSQLIDIQSNITDPLLFYDNTYMRVVGRVVGGDREATRQFGYTECSADSLALRSSRNNIGRARIVFRAVGGRYVNKTVYWSANQPVPGAKVTLTPDSIYSRNDFGIAGSINSGSEYVDDRNNQCVSVLTDSLTGEYIALLPPVKWEIDPEQTALCFDPAEEERPKGYIRSLGNEIQAMGVGSTFSVDLSTGRVETDKIVIDKDLHRDVIADTTRRYTVDFPYHVKKNIVRYAQSPEVTLYDVDRLLMEMQDARDMGEEQMRNLTIKKAHMLGEDTVFVRSQEHIDDTTVVDRKHMIRFMSGKDKSDLKYKFKVPVFLQNSDYSIAIGLHETYHNYDIDPKHPVEDHVPLDSTELTVYNNWASRSVKMDQKWLDERVKTMAKDEMEQFTYETNDTLKFVGKMNANGFAVIQFQAGYPKAMNPYTSTMQLSFKFHGNTMTWPEQPMEGIVMGMVGIPGSSFVTDGPSKVDFVLNDPPGSNSFAYIDKGSSMTLGVSNGLTFGDVTGDESQWAVGVDLATLAGMGIMTKSNVTKKLVGTLQKDAGFDLMTFSDKKSMTYTFNQRIQTSSSPDFVGANGDVYIGRATNYFFTDTRYTNMTTEAERVVPAQDKEMYCVESESYVQRGDTLLGGTKFYLTNWLQPIGGTTNESVFSFTQKHIVTELIPDLRKRRAQLVVYDPAYAQKKSADMPVLPEGECRYFAKRPLDQMDDDMDVWRRDTDYVFQHTAKDKFDKVALYSNAIAKWKSTIAANERNKAYNFYKLDGQTKGKYKQSSLIRNISPEMIAEKYALNLREGIIAMDAVTGALSMANNVVKLVDLMGKVKDFGRISSSVFNPFAIASQALATVWEVAYTVAKNTETQDAKMTQNLHYIDSNTYDAGMTMSNSMTTSQTYTTTRAFSDQHDIQFGGVDNSELAAMSASTQESAKSWAGFRYGSTKNVDASSTGTTTFGYTLSTSGASTYESVDIYLPISPDAKIGDDGEVTGNTSMPYMFYLRGGQSKVPWEKPDSTLYFKQTESFKTSTGKASDAFPLSDGTVALVIPEFDMPSEFAMLPAGEKSNIEATLRNVSVATFSPTVSETAPKLVFGIDPKTNQHGLQFDRGVMTGQYAVGLKPQTSTKLSFTVQQTRTDVTRDTVTFILYPDGDLGRAVKKPVIFNFVPMASPVTLETDRVTVNGEAIEGKQAAREIGVTLTNYHMEYKNFAGVVIQTRLVGTNAWKPIYLFYVDPGKYDLEKDWKGANVKLQAGKSFATITLGDQFTDGDYEIRAVAQSKASREDAGLETASEALRFSLDTKKPMVMGKPTGELLYGENLQLTFDEDISHELVTTDNFTIVTDLDAQVAREHAVAMKIYECGPAETKHEFSLFGYRDFTLAMKFKPISTRREAVLFSQMGQVGDFRVSYDSARVYVRYGDKVMASPTQALDATGGYNSDWMQLVVTYQQDEDTTDGTISSILYTTNDEYAGPAMTLNAIPKTQAILRMGADAGKTNGNVLMHDVMLWDGIVSKEEMEANLENALIGLDKRIIAYWPANEGRGSVVTDLRFERNLVLPAGAEWYSRIPNYSLALDGTQAFRIPTQKVVFSPQESYGLSFWFKSTAAGQNATLCSLDNGTAVNAFTIGAGGEVTAEFAYGGLSIAKVTPNVWHNLFMEYVGGGYTRFYLDGEVVREVESAQIPRFAFDTMTMGGRTVYQEADTTRRVTDFFKGGIDDVRVQKGRFTQNIIADAVNRCLTGREEGLKIYYPFQRIRKLDDPVVAEPCGYNHILQVKDGDEYIDESDRGLIVGAAAIADVVDQDDAPMQKSASFRRPLAGKTEYSVIASEREVLINISEDVARRLEGKTLHITALGIQDVHENVMTPYTWDVIVHQDWGTWVPSLLDLTLPVDTVAEIETGLVKYSRMGSLHLSELAEWMSVRTMTDEGFYYFVVYLVDTRHLSPGVYYSQVSLSNHEGAAIPQTIKLTVKGKDPGWRVDPSRFNANMNLIADLHLNDRLWVSEDAHVAAFIDGECRGVGQLKYNENTNRSLLYLTIFGNDMSKGGDKGKTVTFKAWDPNKGVIYNALRVKDGDSRDVANVTFDSSVLCGAYDRPWHLIAVDVVQHDVPLTSGWNWVSTYVEAVTPTASNLLADVQSHISMVKDRTHAAVPGSAAMGRITIRPNSMYMIHVKTDDPIDRLSISGEKAVSEETIITVPGSKTGWAWGWIGYPCQRTMTLRQALSFLNPHKNDIIKSQTEFAVFDGQDWQGTLGYLNPGRGYMYGNSLGTGEALEFHFPADIGAATQAPAVPSADNPRGMNANGQTAADNPRGMNASGQTAADNPSGMNANGQTAAAGERPAVYPHNMVVIGQTLPGAKVCAFVNGEQRTESVADADGRVYLTVGGEGAMGSLTFVIVDTDDNSRAATTRLQYADDRVDGTVETPVLLLPAATDGHADDAVYDLAGRYMGRFADLRRLAPAVYIMNGLKFNTQR